MFTLAPVVVELTSSAARETVVDPPQPTQEATVKAPALVKEALVNEKMLVPAVVPDRMVSQPEPTEIAVSVAAPAVMPEIERPIWVPAAPEFAPVTRIPVVLMVEVEALVEILRPFHTHVLLPPEQAVRVGLAILIAFTVLAPVDEAPPVTLMVEAMFKPLVIGVKAAVLAEVCSVAAIARPLVVIVPVIVVAVANERLANVPVSAAP